MICNRWLRPLKLSWVSVLGSLLRRSITKRKSREKLTTYIQMAEKEIKQRKTMMIQTRTVSKTIKKTRKRRDLEFHWLALNLNSISIK